MKKTRRAPKDQETLAREAADRMFEAIMADPYYAFGDKCYEMTSPLYDSFYADGTPSDEIDDFLDRHGNQPLDADARSELIQLVDEFNENHRAIGYHLGVAIARKFGGAR
jgi:hypothetical protein